MAHNVVSAYVDTDVIVRLLTADDLKKQKASASLFEKASEGKIVLNAPITVVADTVFVLSSPRLYHLSRVQIRDMITPLLRIPNFKLDNKQIILNALDLYATAALDFGDALLIAFTQESEEKSIYSYDRDFDKIPNIKRLEPKE